MQKMYLCVSTCMYVCVLVYMLLGLLWNFGCCKFFKCITIVRRNVSMGVGF
jgi:hypothetical protein